MKALTQFDMEMMGLVETSPGSGQYVKKPKEDKHKTVGFEVEKQIVCDPIAHGKLWGTIPLESVSVDLFSERKGMIDYVEKEGIEVPYDNTPTGYYKSPFRRTEPFPIPEIRLLTGKKRDIAVAELQEEAKRFVQGIGPTEIYIPTNVASSKNSKQLFKTGKKNATVTRDKEGNTNTVIKETSFITDSQVSKAYRKETLNSWVTNRLKFNAAVEGLKKPYKIELTFIRTTLGKFDFHNMAQLPFDLMVEHGWIVDDESTEIVPVFNPCVFYSKYFTGLVIRVIR